MAAAEVRSGGAVKRSAGKEKKVTSVKQSKCLKNYCGHHILFPTVNVGNW